jgi:dihydropteroate synthase
MVVSPVPSSTLPGMSPSGSTTWDFTAPARVMGILNVTPDSFSDGGRFVDVAAAVAAGERLVASGAAWLDVGGESTRPGARPVECSEELRRIIPVVSALAQRRCGPISIDTTKATVAEAALEAGAAMVNDVSAGTDPAMLPLVAGRRCPIVLMHMRGRPQTMQQDPRYGEVVDEVAHFLEERMKAAAAAGVREEAMLLDPGIGFGKTVAHNLALLRGLPTLAARLGRPLVVGLSRKNFLGRLTGIEDPVGRDGPGHVLHALLAPWCALVRVHDVAGAVAALASAGVVTRPARGGSLA